MSTPGVNPPKQERSKRTLDRIVSAALELIDEEGLEGMTVQRVVRQARSSVGSFYARFSGREDLLRHLEYLSLQEGRARWNEAVDSVEWEGLALEEVVRELVGLLVEARGHEGGRWLRLSAQLRSSGEPELGARAFDEIALRDFQRLIVERATEIAHPDPGLAVELAYRMLTGTIGEFLPMGRESGKRSGEVEVVKSELTRAVLAYLGSIESRGAPTEAATDPFDIWG